MAGNVRVSGALSIQALATPGGLAGWWTDNLDGQSERGAVLKFRFGDGGPDMKVKKLSSESWSAGSAWTGPPNGSAAS